jgi:hypothetical protein
MLKVTAAALIPLHGSRCFCNENSEGTASVLAVLSLAKPRSTQDFRGKKEAVARNLPEKQRETAKEADQLG